MPKKKRSKALIFSLVGSILALALLIFLVFTYIKPAPEPSPAIPPTETTTLTISDFPSDVEGTFSGQVKPNYIKETMDPIVVLFVSSKLPGMAMIYYPQEKKLISGTPQMVAADITLFDGAPHILTYTFKQNNKQALIYDGKVVSESDFKLNSPNALTGMITGAPETGVSDQFESIEIS